MAIQKHIWIGDIMEALFANNDFLNYALNGDQFVVNGKTVHIPQAGAASGIRINGNTFPVNATDRTDVDINFDLDTFQVLPVRVANIDQYEASYDKRASVMRVNIGNLSDRAALQILYRWLAVQGSGDGVGVAAQVIRTTGAATAATYMPGVDGAKSATGNRKKLVKEDLLAAQLIMDNQNVPAVGRKAMIPANMFAALNADVDLIKRDTALELDPATGLIKKLYGFDLIKRSRVAVFNNNATPVAVMPDTADAATQTTANTYNNAAVCWHPDFVYRAKGEIKPFENENDATYYGSVLSFEMRFGGAKARLDGKGVVAIVEDVSA